MEAYIFQAELHCGECITKIMKNLLPPDGYIFGDESSYDSDDYPKGPFNEGGGEADNPNHCGTCGKFLENPLTEEGEAYVRESVNPEQAYPGPGLTALTVWKPFYSYLFD